MGKDFRAIFWKDIRMLVSGKFFLLAMGALALYTLYVNFGYVRLVELSMYKVCLWDPQGICVDGSLLLQRASSREELDRMLLEDPDGVGIDLSRGKAEFLLYRSTPQVERYLEDYARSLLRPQEDFKAEVLGAFTTEEKQRREITCELLFFELSAVGFLGIAAVLFREKGMGVLRVHACLPVRGRLFLLSKLAVQCGCGAGTCDSAGCPGGDGDIIAFHGAYRTLLRPVFAGFPPVYHDLSGDCGFCGDAGVSFRQHFGKGRVDFVPSLLSSLYGNEKCLFWNPWGELLLLCGGRCGNRAFVYADCGGIFQGDEGRSRGPALCRKRCGKTRGGVI